MKFENSNLTIYSSGVWGGAPSVYGVCHTMKFQVQAIFSKNFGKILFSSFAYYIL